MNVELLIKFRLSQIVENDTRWSAKLTTSITLCENGIRGYVTQYVVSREDPSIRSMETEQAASRVESRATKI